ncbi:hypothetical protein BH09SUM1_BH09SUM1_21720 [soil metagenome]
MAIACWNLRSYNGMKIVLPGGSGQVGAMLARSFVADN